MIHEATNIAVSLGAMAPSKRKLLRREVARALGTDMAHLGDLRIVRRSVDARKKGNVHFVVSVTFKLMGIDAAQLRPAKGISVHPWKAPLAPSIPDLSDTFVRNGAARPIVVGAGPAGLFCALWLARAGLRPIVVERGQAVEDRARTVAAFDAGAALDPQSNIQFGEGGAGAFSDGKLTCGKSDPNMRHVLQAFVDAGAPADILVDAKPHIGTDHLPATVRGLRKAIQAAGGEFRFNTQLVGIRVEADGVQFGDAKTEEAAGSFDIASASSHVSHKTSARSQAIKNHEEIPCSDDVSPAYGHRLCAGIFCDLLTGTEFELPVATLVLAIGHSARDTVEMLLDAGVRMQRKPFAVGVRIEHPQALIDRAQYGRAAGHPALPPAEYKLNVRTADDRGVYTFCMCPGGTVVAAASEPGGVCTNGMSTHARNGRNANSALLVEVRPEDLPGEDVLAGVRFQRQLERAAYDLAQSAGVVVATQPFAAPAQTVGAFLADGSDEYRADESDVSVIPTYPRGVVEAPLRSCLPPFVADALAEALPKLDRKLDGFADPGAVLTAVEARSSSPVRMVRDRQTRQAANISGLFPAGEGAGYAGGIMSAATDGIRTAETIISAFALAQVVVAPDAIVDHLLTGAPTIFETDTVVGLGLAAQQAQTPALLYELKGRAADKPVSWLVDGPQALDQLGADAPLYAHRLAERFWPGALTLVVRASDKVPRAFASRKGTIGLRMPEHAPTLALIGRVGPLAATSANRSDTPAPHTLAQVDPGLLLAVGHALAPLSAAPVASSGIASTVVDCTGPEPRILREGNLAAEVLRVCAETEQRR